MILFNVFCDVSDLKRKKMREKIFVFCGLLGGGGHFNKGFVGG